MIRRCRVGFTITVIFRISSGRSIIKRSFFAHHNIEGKKNGFYIPKRDKRVHDHEISPEVLAITGIKPGFAL